MLSTRRARLTALVGLVVVAAALPAAVLAAQPKTGVYIDPKLQVYVEVRGAPPHVKRFQGPCLVTPQGGGPAVQSGGYILNKNLKISTKGKFSYNGKVKLQAGDGSDSRVKVKIAGRFKHGKAKGTVTFDSTTSACNKTTFSGKYYGKNPQG
jgi:hypothetical protein